MCRTLFAYGPDPFVVFHNKSQLSLDSRKRSLFDTLVYVRVWNCVDGPFVPPERQQAGLL